MATSSCTKSPNAYQAFQKDFGKAKHPPTEIIFLLCGLSCNETHIVRVSIPFPQAFGDERQTCFSTVSFQWVLLRDVRQTVLAMASVTLCQYFNHINSLPVPKLRIQDALYLNSKSFFNKMLFIDSFAASQYLKVT
jgi:hypothetical protein